VISVRGKFYLYNSMKSMHTVSIFDNSQSMTITLYGTTLVRFFFKGKKKVEPVPNKEDGEPIV